MNSLMSEQVAAARNKSQEKPAKNESSEDGQAQDTKTSTQPDKDKKGREQADGTTDAQPQVFMDAVTAPFKADGRQVQFTDPEDIKTLMQKGVHYARKMKELKPIERLGKTLERAKIDDDALNLLIDARGGSLDALLQVARDAKIDPEKLLDKMRDADDNRLDADGNPEQTRYKARDHRVGEDEMQLAEVLDGLESSSPNYQQLLDFMSNTLDDSSREALVANPSDIRVLAAHMDNGVFKQVWDAVEHERVLDRLQGMSDLEAYRAVAIAMQKQGALSNQENAQAARANNAHRGGGGARETGANGAQQTGANGARKTGADNVGNRPTREQRRAQAGPGARPAPAASGDPGLGKNLDPSRMSDEEFNKWHATRLA